MLQREVELNMMGGRPPDGLDEASLVLGRGVAQQLLKQVVRLSPDWELGERALDDLVDVDELMFNHRAELLTACPAFRHGKENERRELEPRALFATLSSHRRGDCIALRGDPA
jgi:hypothetical protein